MYFLKVFSYIGGACIYWSHKVPEDFPKTLYLQCALCSQPAITYSKLTIETLEQGVKYVQS